MIKAVIIDDEYHSIETLEWKIKNYTEGLTLLATFTDPEKGLDYLNNNSIDLLFLDIEMPVLNGFDLLHRLEDINFNVIFSTAYDDYGIKAIKYSSLDYLLKPVQEAELRMVIEKHKASGNRHLLPKQLEVLLQNMSDEAKEKRRIALATKENIELFYPHDITLCQSNNNYSWVFIEGREKKLISKPLKEFEEILTDHGFFRTHQSYLINMQHVKEYIRRDDGYIIMSNDQKIPLSRNKKDDFLARMF